MAEFIADDELATPPRATTGARPTQVAPIGLTRESQLRDFASNQPGLEDNLPDTNGSAAANIAQIDSELRNLKSGDPRIALLQTERAKFSGWGGSGATVSAPKANGGRVPSGNFIPDEELGGRTKPATGTDYGKLRQQVNTALGQKPGERATLRPFMGVVDGVVNRLKNVGGEATAIADFVMGFPAMILGTGAQLAGTVIAGAGHNYPWTAKPGEQTTTAYTAGRMAGKEISEPIAAGLQRLNPVRALIEFIGSEDLSGKSITSGTLERLDKKLSAAGDWVENTTGGRIPRESVVMLTDTLMTALPGAFAKGKPLISPEVQNAMREQIRTTQQDMARRAKEDADFRAILREPVQLRDPSTMTPEEFARQPVQQSINNLLGIRPEAEQASLRAARMEQAQQGFHNPEQGGDYVDTAESQFRASERTPEDGTNTRLSDTIRDKYLKMAEDGELRAGRVAQAEALKDMTPRAADLRGEGPAPAPTALAETLAEKYLKAAEAAELKAAQLAQADSLKEITAGRGDLRGRGPNVPPELRAEVLGQDVLAKLSKDELQSGYDALSANLKSMTVTPTELQAIMRGRRLPAVEQRLMNQNDTLAPAQNTMSAATDPRPGMRELFQILTKPEAQRSAADLAKLKSAGITAAMAAGVGTAVAADALLNDQDSKGLLGSAVLGAGIVLGKPGSLHPEVARTLSAPLANRIASAEGMRFDVADKWSERTISRFLQKRKNELADVEVPFGEGTKPLGELFEASLDSAPAGGYKLRREIPGSGGLSGRTSEPAFPNIPPNEPLWNISKGEGTFTDPYGNRPAEAIKSYLSHVGDFLSEQLASGRLTPEKLQQRDLTWAIRETVKWDKELARKMEKARQDDTASSPVYKDYGDGMRWVQLTKPGQFARESDAMGHSVRGYEPPANRVSIRRENGGYEKHPDWIPASGDSGHSSYGLGGWEAVKKGKAKIYSLRDAKGESHATIEVGVETPRDRFHRGALPEGTSPRMMQELAKLGYKWQSDGDKHGWRLNGEYVRDTAVYPVMEKVLADLGLESVPKITQIKGKQNRAPAERYLPYIQDFVKGGKWGEVGDLGNAGLHDVATAAPDIVKTAQRLYPDRRYLDKAEVEKVADAAYTKDPTLWPQNGPGHNQRGMSNTKMLIGLTGLGVGSLVGANWAQDPVHGAVLGALGGAAIGFGLTSTHFKDAVRGLDKAAGMISTRILNRSGLEQEPNARSTPIHKELSQFYRTRMAQTSALVEKVTPWMKASVNLPKAEMGQLAVDIANRDPAAVGATNKINPALGKGWVELRTVLQDLGQRAQSIGRYKELLSDYFPLRVRDHEGLLKSMGAQQRTAITDALKEAEAKAKSQHRTLSQVEQDVVINQTIRGFTPPQTLQPGYAKARTVGKYTPEILKFYHTPQEAILLTIADVVKDLETAKFFGRELVQGSQGGRTYVNIDASIGSLVGREMKAGRLRPEHEAEFVGLMKSLFNGAEQSPHRLVQDARNVAYGTTLGDLPSAVMQLGDPFGTMYSQGFRNTLIGLGRMLTGSNKLTMKSMGMADHVAEDIARSSVPGSARGRNATIVGAAIGGVAGALLADDVKGALPGAFAGAFTGRTLVNGTAEVLHRALAQGVFKPMDSFGKNSNFGASVENFHQRAQTPAGQAKIKEWYGTAFGKDFPQLLQDLKTGTMSEDVRTLAFMEMSRTQPISKMEQAQLMADHPNARLLVALKTWAEKQADVFRRDAYNKIKNGDALTKLKGMRDLTLFATALAASNMAPQYIKDFILGRKTEFETTDVFENVLKTFGLSNFVMEKMKEGEWGPVRAIGASALPPYAIMDRIITADPKAVQYVPVVGELYYNWELGGREEDEIRKAKAFKKRTGFERDLSIRAENYRDNKRERAQERRERLTP